MRIACLVLLAALIVVWQISVYQGPHVSFSRQEGRSLRGVGFACLHGRAFVRVFSTDRCVQEVKTPTTRIFARLNTVPRQAVLLPMRPGILFRSAHITDYVMPMWMLVTPLAAVTTLLLLIHVVRRRRGTCSCGRPREVMSGRSNRRRAGLKEKIIVGAVGITAGLIAGLLAEWDYPNEDRPVPRLIAAYAGLAVGLVAAKHRHRLPFPARGNRRRPPDCGRVLRLMRLSDGRPTHLPGVRDTRSAQSGAASH